MIENHTILHLCKRKNSSHNFYADFEIALHESKVVALYFKLPYILNLPGQYK